MCKRPRNVGCGSIPRATATNSHDDCVGFGGTCETGNRLHGLPEFDAYLSRTFSESGIGCGHDLQFGLSFNPSPFEYET